MTRKTLVIGTKTQAQRVQVDSLFKPINGGTLNAGRLDLGKYNRNLKGESVEVSERVQAVWCEKRKDKDGGYWALFCMTSN